MTSSRTRGRLIVFEGIDGSGKTTVSNLVAEALRARGLSVVHVRSGGRLASATAERVREVARDQRNLPLAPFAELLLYVTRETQQLEEHIRPALAEADVVIADRFFHTAQVLACHGRGLPPARAIPVLRAASAGLEPHLTVLVDVDLHVARARRRADKIARPASRTGSRKGLSGTSLMDRLRRGYRELAAEDREHWLVVDNTSADLPALVDELAGAITAARDLTPARWPATPDLGPRRRAEVDTSGPARPAFLAWLDARLSREPEVVAYLLGGCAGDGFDERRFAVAHVAGAITAAGLAGLDDEPSWVLRRALAASHPAQVARSLAGEAGVGERAAGLRRELAAWAPLEVADSLAYLPGADAWALRRELWSRAPVGVLASLAGDDGDEAWCLRERWLASVGGEATLATPELARALCASLRGLAGGRAWTLRRLARDGSPVGALLSLRGVSDERSWRWRERWLPAAPRPVLATIHALDDEHAWALRERSWPFAKEAVDSISGLDSVRAWRLREATAHRYPSTVAKSLGLLAHRPDGRALLARLRQAFPRDLSLLRHAARLESMAALRQATAS